MGGASLGGGTRGGTRSGSAAARVVVVGDVGVCERGQGQGETGVDGQQLVSARRQGRYVFLQTLVLLSQLVQTVEKGRNCTPQKTYLCLQHACQNMLSSDSEFPPSMALQ